MIMPLGDVLHAQTQGGRETTPGIAWTAIDREAPRFSLQATDQFRSAGQRARREVAAREHQNEMVRHAVDHPIPHQREAAYRRAARRGQRHGRANIGAQTVGDDHKRTQFRRPCPTVRRAHGEVIAHIAAEKSRLPAHAAGRAQRQWTPRGVSKFAHGHEDFGVNRARAKIQRND